MPQTLTNTLTPLHLPAGQLFGTAGLAVPQMCRKVLEFDAASVPHATRSRRSLERYLLGTTGFRGRALSLALGDSGSAVGAVAEEQLPVQEGPRLRPQPQPLRIEEDVDGLVGDLGDDEAAEEGRPLLDGAHAAGKQVLVPSADGEPVLVSILLPANASGGSKSSSKLAVADKVFVVLLHPQDKYVTYSCDLPRAVVV